MRVEQRPRLTAARRRILDDLMDQFLDLDSAERAVRLDQFRQRYPRLHVWLDRLLAQAAAPTEFFGSAVARTADRALGLADELPVLKPGERLGPWRIIDRAGQGGMGIVYRAERADGAFDMDVAIKLIASRLSGVADRLVLERQLLARLNHPGISRLIDGGVTDQGQAFLVMEWVPGEDLSEQQRPALDPIGIFLQIADALTHAHQRMVVHGDIKPGNVRITPEGQARLLDFGVARLLAEEGDQQDLSLRALTPAFAAPELLAGQPATAQSDVWAMGALLNWLLTGRRPAGDGTAPITDVIVHDKHKDRSPDLAAVIATACAADPAERYASVAALAEEVRCIRDHHPIRARPVGPLRRLRMWSRRNPVGAALALVLTVGAVSGAAALAWQAEIVRAERDLARFENTRWETMRDQLVTLFRDVAEDADDRELGARQLLDGSVDRLDELLAGDERGRAYIESMLGSLYVALQDYQSAAGVLRRFVAADDGSTPLMLRSGAYANLALAEVYLGAPEAALELIDQALAMVEGQAGDYRRRQSELHVIRGSALRARGEWSASIETLERGVALAMAVNSEPNRPLAMALNNLGVTLNNAGRIDDARTVFESSLNHWRAMNLADSSDALTVVSNLATIYHQQGDLDLAERAYAEAIAVRQQRFGESAALAAVMNNHGQVLIIRHRLAQARNQLEQARDMMARFNGQNSPHYALMLRSLSMLALTEGNIDEAMAHIDQAEAILLATVGPDHLFTVIVGSQRAAALAQREPAASVTLFRQLVEQLSALGRSAETHLATALCEKAVIQIELDDLLAARSSAERCRQIRQARLPEGSWEITKAEALIAIAETGPGVPDADDRKAELVAALADTYGPAHPRLTWLQAKSQ